MSELANSLPHVPSDIPIIILTVKGKDNALKDVLVWRQKVEQALRWLLKHNPQYRCVTIDTNALESLPSNGIPNIRTVETLEDPDAVDDQDTDTILTGGEVVNCDKETNSFLPVSSNSCLESEEIKSNVNNSKINWPSIDDQPLNEYTTPFLATLAFPTLFPDGNGDPTNPCLQRDVPFGNQIQHLLKYSENIDGKWVYRFSSHPRFSYWALNMIQRKRAIQQTSIFLKQNPDECHLTVEELQEIACSNSSSTFMSKLSRYVANVTGSCAYWFKVKEDLKAIIVAKGAPTIFFTFSLLQIFTGLNCIHFFLQMMII